jgi:hypothetical protein
LIGPLKVNVMGAFNGTLKELCEGEVLVSVIGSAAFAFPPVNPNATKQKARAPISPLPRCLRTSDGEVDMGLLSS